MQSFEELMSMDDVALRDLAESMGMKKNSTDNKEEMAYFVIDNASAQVAREEAARLKPRAQKERKPRTKRVSAAVAPESQEGDATTDVKAEPKRRGRKPKTVVEPDETQAIQAPAEKNGTDVPPSNEIATGEAPAESTPKRRTRKTKTTAEKEIEATAPSAETETRDNISENVQIADTLPMIIPDEETAEINTTKKPKQFRPKTEPVITGPEYSRSPACNSQTSGHQAQRPALSRLVLFECKRQDLHTPLSAADPGRRKGGSHGTHNHCRTGPDNPATPETAETSDQETAPAGTHASTPGQHSPAGNHQL